MKFHYRTAAGGVSKPGWIVDGFVCVRTTRSLPGESDDWKPVGVNDPVWASLDGEQGERGERGEQGEASTVPGPAGADGLAGESFTPRGEWKRKTQYKRLDVVYVPGEGAFVATVDDPTKAPPSKGWMQITADGADGKDGEAVVYAQRGRPGRDGRDAEADTPAVADVPMNVGDAIYPSGAGRVDLAIGSPAVDGDDVKAFPVGVVTAVNGSAIAYRTSGVVTNPSWSLTPRAVYYLSVDTPGGLTTTFPEGAGEFVIIMGTAVSPTQLALNIHWMVENA